MYSLTLAAAFLVTVAVWGAPVKSALSRGTASDSRLPLEPLFSKGATAGRSATETLYCNRESTAAMLERLNDGATICDLSSSSFSECSDSHECTEVLNCTRWTCDTVSQSLVQEPCTALCQYHKRILSEAGVNAIAAAGASTQTTGGAAAYLVVAGGTAVDANGYGINVSCTTFSDSGLHAILSPMLPPGVTLLDGGGVTMLTLDNLTASIGLPSLDGKTSYLELHIPASGVDLGKLVGCLSYNATSNILQTAAGNISGLSAEVVPPPASYNSSTGEVICHLTSVVGTYVVAQQAAVNSSGGSRNSSSSSSNKSRGNSGAGGGAQGIVALVIACTVGGIMVIPLTVLGITVCVMRKRRVWNEENASGHQLPKPQGLTPTGRAGAASSIAVHPKMDV
ncbi:hypothetical protein VaNZ11_007611 [Volvox africanus]|uniref:Mid2 domain-containing protein n=1 Tax=Volvox africanus TaxID=51714 RepID=A0ABQ5S383_9CHLO|nr:hypothetical protein VaNZ11_007611 [Volvox africanus]